MGRLGCLKRKTIGILVSLTPHTSKLLSLKKFLEYRFFLRERKNQDLKCLVIPWKRLFLYRVPQMEEIKCDILQYGKGRLLTNWENIFYSQEIEWDVDNTKLTSVLRKESRTNFSKSITERVWQASMLPWWVHRAGLLSGYFITLWLHKLFFLCRITYSSIVSTRKSERRSIRLKNESLIRVQETEKSTFGKFASLT